MKKEFILKEYLVNNAPGRERKNKSRCISNIVQRNHPSIKDIPWQVMVEIVDDVVAYERYWRKILLDNPELRGMDYDTKKVVVQKKQIELGYEGGYNMKVDV